MHRLQWLEPDWENGQGLGFAIWRVGNKTIVGHGGILLGYHTNISFLPEEKIGVIVLTNSYDGDPFSYAQQFYELVAPAIAKAAAPPAKASPVDPAWNNYVGLYRASYGDSQVQIVNGKLVVFDPQAQDIQKSLLTLTPTGPNMFKISGKDGDAEIGETLVFELAPDGKVMRMKVGANYRYPVR